MDEGLTKTHGIFLSNAGVMSAAEAHLNIVSSAHWFLYMPQHLLRHLHQHPSPVHSMTAEGEIMGVKHRTLPIWGVQFHPESILTEQGRTILKNFLKLK